MNGLRINNVLRRVEFSISFSRQSLFSKLGGTLKLSAIDDKNLFSQSQKFIYFGFHSILIHLFDLQHLLHKYYKNIIQKLLDQRYI